MGNKSKLGPLIGMIGDGAFFAINVMMGLWLLVPVCAVAFCIHVRNFWKWNNE